LTCARKRKEVERSLVSRAIFLPSPRMLPFAVPFLFLFFFHGFQKPYLLYGIWQQACVGGFRKHQVVREIEGDRQRCVCGSNREQTVKLMYLPPEETMPYPHGDFVPSPISLLLLFYPAIN
jgi:hypothetical protein